MPKTSARRGEENAPSALGSRQSAFLLIRRTLLFICALAIAWGAGVYLTGGFTIPAGPLRLASRNPSKPFLLAFLAAAIACALPIPDRWSGLRADLRRHLHPARIIVLLGAFLVVYHWAIGRPMWLDEEMIALNVRERGLADLARGLWLGQSAPYGWLAGERGMLVVFGDGERSMRFVPAVLAVCTIVAAWWVGRRWLGAAAGTLLVLLCTFGEWISYYSVELKQYSGDLFWGLLLPALGAWVLAGPRSDRASVFRRGVTWWAAAAFGQLTANGALLATPGVAVVLTALLARRRGRLAALSFAACGLLWLGAFALNYVVALRHALSNSFLEIYWGFALPPNSAGPLETIGWVLAQAKPIAVKPGGTELWILLWLLAIAGFVVARNRDLGALFATVPASAGVLAALRVVPLFERISLWVVPAVYVGVALLLDSSIALLRWPGRLRIASAAAACLAIAAVCVLSLDILRNGIKDVRGRHPSDSNHQLDDRTAVRWAMQQLRPGDALITTRLALPALWWYGNLPISETFGAGSRTPGGIPVIQVGYARGGAACTDNALERHLATARRALVVYGFRFDDVPAGFDGRLARDLASLGTLQQFERFTGRSGVAVFDLTANVAEPSPRPSESGCITARPARRW